MDQKQVYGLDTVINQSCFKFVFSVRTCTQHVMNRLYDML